MHSPTSIIGTLGQCALISGYHLLATFSKELRALMEKQTRKQSVCKQRRMNVNYAYEYLKIHLFEKIKDE